MSQTPDVKIKVETSDQSPTEKLPQEIGDVKNEKQDGLSAEVQKQQAIKDLIMAEVDKLIKKTPSEIIDDIICNDIQDIDPKSKEILHNLSSGQLERDDCEKLCRSLKYDYQRRFEHIANE